MGTCRISAGSGDVGRAQDWIQVDPRAGGVNVVAEPVLVNFGREQHEQKWQFGEHWPPETSVGQVSSQSASPQIIARPLTSNVSKAKKVINTARRTAPSLPQTAAGRDGDRTA